MFRVAISKMSASAPCGKWVAFDTSCSARYAASSGCAASRTFADPSIFSNQHAKSFSSRIRSGCAVNFDFQLATVTASCARPGGPRRGARRSALAALIFARDRQKATHAQQMVRMCPFRGRQKEPMGAISPDLYIGCGEPLDPLFYWVFSSRRQSWIPGYWQATARRVSSTRIVGRPAFLIHQAGDLSWRI
jgi:hypothetical protein